MKISAIQRSGGLAMITGSVLLALWSVLRITLLPVIQRVKDFSVIVSNQHWILISTIAFAGVLLMIFGFTAVYSLFYSRAGIIGFLGFLFVVTAFILEACQIAWEIFVYPAILSHLPSIPLFSESILMHHPMIALFRLIFQIILALGVVLFTFSLISTKEFHKSAGILIFIGAVVYALGPMISTYVAVSGVLVLSAGCLVLGRRLII